MILPFILNQNSKIKLYFNVLRLLQIVSLKGTKFSDSLTGCSRTNPIEWGNVNVKKEPGACQVAEISTSVSPIVKLEVTSPTQKNEGGLVNSSIISTTGEYLKCYNLIGIFLYSIFLFR